MTRAETPFTVGERNMLEDIVARLEGELQIARIELGRLRIVKGTRPWRTGAAKRTIYDNNGALLGTMDTAELAVLVVRAVNELGAVAPGVEVA